ncbi:unnamed protein product [Cochlearia groenlandica]
MIGRSFSDDEYEKLHNRLTSLFKAIITFIMLFFAGHGKQYITDAVKRVPVLAAGCFGLVFSVLSLVDSIVRSRFPKFKLFGVVSLASAYFSVGFVGSAIYAFYPSTKRSKSDPRLKSVMARLEVEGDRRFDVLHLATLIGIILKPDDPETDELCKIVLLASEDVLNVRVDEPGGSSQIAPGDSDSEGVTMT